MTTLTSTFIPTVVCKNFMYNNCQRTNCKFIHDNNICFYFWKFGSCKRESDCNKSHTFVKDQDQNKTQNKDQHKNQTVENKGGENEDGNSKNIKQKKNKDKYDKELRKNLKNKKKHVKNTECFDPMKMPVDIRISYDLGTTNVSSKITSREVLLVPNLFSDFKTNEIYDRLVSEIENCGIPKDTLLKLWHGDSHLIADDHLAWKSKCPTFSLVINRIRDFFKMDIKATRFNWYVDTNQWKPFHHDAAAVKPEKMNTQNFTVGISFGVTREAAFEHAKTKTTISIPQPDGCIYAFSKDTNVIWRHGILQDVPSKQQGRISIIAWGWIDDQITLQ